MSNGEYKSVDHRGVVNPEKERISIVSLHSSNTEAVIGPLPDLTVEKAPHYKTLSHEDYMRQVVATKPDGKSRLDLMRL